MDTQSKQPKESGYQLAKRSLIFGILSLFGPIVALVFSYDFYDMFSLNPLLKVGLLASLMGLPAMLIGNEARKRIIANQEKGLGVAFAGMILGAVGILFDIGCIGGFMLISTGY